MTTRVKRSKEVDALIDRELDTRRPKKNKEEKGKDSKGEKSSKSKEKDSNEQNPWFTYEASPKLRELLLRSAHFSRADQETISKIPIYLRVHQK